MLTFITDHWTSLTIAILALAAIGLACVVMLLMDKKHTHEKLLDVLKKVGNSLLHWTWTKSLLFWLTISAGTFSELAFLLASTWMSVNAAEHSFVLMFMNQLQSEQVSYFAKSAYVVLPVFILPLGVTTTLTHARTWRYTKRLLHPSSIWFVLYLLPTLTFLVIDICVIGNSNTVNYTLPDILVTFRSIMAYTYGLIAVIYHYVGKHQEVDRLSEKDSIIAQLRNTLAERESSITERNNTITSLESDIVHLKDVTANQGQELIELRLAVATHKMTRQKSDSATTPDENDAAPGGYDANEKNTAPLRAVRHQNTQNTQNAEKTVSPLAAQIKEHLRQNIKDGEKINLKKTSLETGISYTTVRKYAEDIIAELTQEHAHISLVR